MDISNALDHIGGFVDDHLPAILSFFACCGVVGTGYLVYQESFESKRAYYDLKENNPEELRTIKGIAKVAKPLAPAIATGMATIGCICGAEIINADRITNLTERYNYLADSFTDYKAETKNVAGEGAAAAVVGAIAKKHMNDAKMREPLGVRNGEQMFWFFDWYSNEWFASDWRTVKDAEIKLNQMLRDHGEALVESYYEFLGIDYPQHLLDYALKSHVDLVWYLSDLRMDHKRDDIPIVYGEVHDDDGVFLGYSIDFPILPGEENYIY